MEYIYNFHSDIAIPLESIALKVFGYKDRKRCLIFDADHIETSGFIEIMITVLNYSNDYQRSLKIDRFAVSCKEYFMVNGNQIPKEQAIKIFDEFKDLLDKIKNNCLYDN